MNGYEEFIADLEKLKRRVAALEAHETRNLCHWRGYGTAFPASALDGDLFASGVTTVYVYVSGAWRTA